MTSYFFNVCLQNYIAFINVDNKIHISLTNFREMLKHFITSQKI